MKTYVIIGGGAAGIAVAAQLRQYANNQLFYSPFKIYLVEKKEFGQGVAFSTQSPAHLLNIPAQFMSLLIDEPSHFLDWARKIDPQVSSESFVLRRRYGEYLKSILQELEMDPSLLFEKINDSVIALDKKKEKFVVSLSNARKIEADSVVLATGNSPPPHLPVPAGTILQSLNYVRDPWKQPFNPGQEESVCIVGTGLTMVDMVLDLVARGHRGRIYAISRHGLLPFPYSKTKRVPQELRDPPKQTHTLLKEVRKKIKMAKNQEEQIAILQDYLWYFRMHWKTFDEVEIERFNRHLFRYHAVAQHRIPFSSFDILQQCIRSQLLTLLTGRLQNVLEQEKGFEITFRLRYQESSQQLSVNHLVNCMASAKALKDVNDPFIHDLLNKGFISLTSKGYICETQGDILPIGKDQSAIHGLYIIGALKKNEWSGASFIPSIAYYAKKIAHFIHTTN